MIHMRHIDPSVHAEFRSVFYAKTGQDGWGHVLHVPHVQRDDLGGQPASVSAPFAPSCTSATGFAIPGRSQMRSKQQVGYGEWHYCTPYWLVAAATVSVLCR